MKKWMMLLLISVCLIGGESLTFGLTHPEYPLPVGSTGTGTMTPSGEHAVEYWLVKLTEYGSLKVSLSAPVGVDGNLHAVSGSNVGFFSVQYLDKNKQIFMMPNLAPGTYKIEVDSRSAAGSYTIKNEFIPASVKSEGSIDSKPGSLNDAQVLAINTSTTGLLGYSTGFNTDGSDAYKISVPVDGRLEVQFTGEPTLKGEVFLYDENKGVSIKGENGAVSNKLLVHENIGAGVYYIKLVESVNRDGSDSYGAYTLTTKLIPNAVPNDSEKNDTDKTAIPLKPSKIVYGHMGYISATQNDQVDFYSFNLSKSGYLRIDLANDRTLNAGVSLYQLSNGLNWLGGTNEKRSSKYVIIPVAKAGTYFLRVSGNGFGGYGLKYLYTSTTPGKMSPISVDAYNAVGPSVTSVPVPSVNQAPTTVVVPSAAISTRLGNAWTINEGDVWYGTWTRRGNSDIFDAKWKSVIDGKVLTDVLKVTAIENNRITIYREGTHGNYYGTLSADGTQITNGTCDWVNEHWSAVLK